MSASVNSPFGSQFEAQVDDSATRVALGSMTMGARAGVVNRTHRVIRQRAQVMQARRSRMRGMLAPMIICSALLLLIAFAVWTGLYQNPADAAEVVQADNTAAAATATVDANNHSAVALLWFVPVCMAVPAMVLYRRRRESAADKAGR